MLPEKQGAPGGAVQVPLSSLPGQWPRQKQVIAPVSPRFITISTKEAATVHALTLAPAMSPKSTGGENAIFSSQGAASMAAHRLLSCCFSYMVLHAREACCFNCSATAGRAILKLLSAVGCGGRCCCLGGTAAAAEASQLPAASTPHRHGAARKS